MTSGSLYYVAEVRDPDTCRVSGYVVKEAGTKTKVGGCPVYATRKLAERFLEGLRSV